MEYIGYMTPATAVALVRALEPILRLQPSLHDYLMIILRKSLFSREPESRSSLPTPTQITFAVPSAVACLCVCTVKTRTRPCAQLRQRVARQAGGAGLPAASLDARSSRLFARRVVPVLRVAGPGLCGGGGRGVGGGGAAAAVHGAGSSDAAAPVQRVLRCGAQEATAARVHLEHAGAALEEVRD
eukprot:3144319-Rhodomonas_salina.2